MNTKRIKELAALTDGELARKLLIQEFGNDSEAHWGNNAHDERVNRSKNLGSRPLGST